MFHYGDVISFLIFSLANHNNQLAIRFPIDILHVSIQADIYCVCFSFKFSFSRNEETKLPCICVLQVLDMCAAPGSKTAQLIEFLHSTDTADNPIPSIF